ncbi:hypothetical protein FOXB_14724 [Fusarium oxysporum f. sp. conglutinans Fo5176]|uniref:Uncharacterized protein n=1 Tax=Fusarium oxysporum (strain Fo5176) TaxID=660025 RepID=F9G7U2_FUSOF|nr:hypothetical protein FOXB_14724 [Fusarium oxysporum f. sp. conglutinans Fo5176]
MAPVSMFSGIKFAGSCGCMRAWNSEAEAYLAEC